MLIPFISQLSIAEQVRWCAALQQALPGCKLVMANELSETEKQDCAVAIVANPSAAQLVRFKKLIWVQSLWAGVEHLVPLATANKFKVVRLKDPVLAQTMAEAVLAWSLYLHRDMPKYRVQQQKKIWQQQTYIPAAERHIGILGLGQLGRASAEILLNHGFSVKGWSRTEKQGHNFATYSGAAGLSKMLSEVDILICLLPLTKQTRLLLDNKCFNSMRKGSSIINFARGDIVNHQHLLSALDAGQIKHAILDVFEQEPLQYNSPLWHHSAITILPHISAATNINSACKLVAANIQCFQRSGLVPENVDMSLGY